MARKVFLNKTILESKPLPCIPGWEGSGIVIQHAGTLQGWNLLGKRVAFVTSPAGYYGSSA